MKKRLKKLCKLEKREVDEEVVDGSSVSRTDAFEMRRAFGPVTDPGR